MHEQITAAKYEVLVAYLEDFAHYGRLIAQAENYESLDCYTTQLVNVAHNIHKLSGVNLLLP
jgi:hypothetical protein